MITIPLYFFLGVYLLYLLFFLLFSLANVYHLITTGTFTTPAFIITALTSAWCITILAYTYYVLSTVNWFSNLILFSPGGTVLFQ